MSSLGSIWGRVRRLDAYCVICRKPAFGKEFGLYCPSHEAAGEERLVRKTLRMLERAEAELTPPTRDDVLTESFLDRPKIREHIDRRESHLAGPRSDEERWRDTLPPSIASLERDEIDRILDGQAEDRRRHDEMWRRLRSL